MISKINSHNPQSKISCCYAPQKNIMEAKSSGCLISYGNNNNIKIPVESLKAYNLSFSAKTQQQEPIPTRQIENVIKSVKDKKYQGLSIYIPEGETKPTANIQWEKIKWENLKQEPINWQTAKKEDVLSFWNTLALCEIQETTWVNKFNPTNCLTALSTGHAISSPQAKEKYGKNINELDAYKDKYDVAFVKNQKSMKETSDASLEKLKKILSKQGHPVYLDQPLIDPKTGKFGVDFSVFDTETTGVGDTDRIIQIGAIKFKEGKPAIKYNKFFDPEMEVPEGAVNVHGLSREVLINEHKAKPLTNSLTYFNRNVIGNNLLVAYNSQFDIGKLNHEVDLYNQDKDKNVLKHKEKCLTLDPFLMIQRIHPFVGVRKKLGEQYKFFFGKDMEGQAHDALADVNATVDILKYTALYLNKHFKPTKDKKALTVGDFLTFQFGGKVKGLNIELDNELKIDKNKVYGWSYRYQQLNADNFPDGCTLENGNYENIIKQHGEKLGEDNISKLKKLKDAMLEAAVENSSEKAILEKRVKTPNYSPQSLIRVFNSPEYKIEEHNGVSREKLISLICENSPNSKTDFRKTLWIKNINPWDTQNDLPDMEISRQVMLDKPAAEIKKLVKKGELPDLSKQQDSQYYTKFAS